MPRVPTTAQVIPGAAVNIILKADQPTGRTVAGCVSTLLTRGNHPRGIKVRLTDGRVGRVQSMAAGAGAGTGTVMGPASEASHSISQENSSTSTRTPALPSQNIGLDAYIKEPRRKGKSGNSARSTRQPFDGPGDQEADVVAPSSEGSVACPVCDDFKGDEAAVAHHVSSHFD
ncbi:hypothetical protein BJX99DRAFT_226524 [Aspergillus californicus]